jgi:hypothetical protein
MSANWQLLSKSQDGALYLNPKNASSNALVRMNSNSALSTVSSASGARPLHVNISNSRTKLAFKCANDSPFADRLLTLAERIERKACMSSLLPSLCFFGKRKADDDAEC